jgi:hypothetical protein
VGAIDDEILHRAGVASSNSATAEYDQAEDVKRVGVQPATTTKGRGVARSLPLTLENESGRFYREEL